MRVELFDFETQKSVAGTTFKSGTEDFDDETFSDTHRDIEYLSRKRFPVVVDDVQQNPPRLSTKV